MSGDRRLLIADLGVVPYHWATQLQETLVEAKLNGLDADFLLLLQHPHVVTLGASATPADRRDAESLRTNGVEVARTRRGGRMTCHAPGQLVGYPIMALQAEERDLHRYVRRIEEAIIGALYPIGIPGDTRTDETGVWVDDRKVCSIGVAVRSWITYHGFALNVSIDMNVFDRFAPCGMGRSDMASLQELGYQVAMDDLLRPVSASFANMFARKGKLVKKQELFDIAGDQRV